MGKCSAAGNDNSPQKKLLPGKAGASIRKKKVADGRKATVLIPLIVVPIQVEVPLVGVLVGIEDVPVAVRVHPDRADCVQWIICGTAP